MKEHLRRRQQCYIIQWLMLEPHQMKLLPSSKIFIATIFSRFKNKSSTEINQMLRILDIKETRCGREIFAEGEQQGKLEGKLEGKTEMLVSLARKRFPKLSQTTVKQIQKLDFLQLERLADVLFDLPNLAAVKTWLQEQK